MSRRALCSVCITFALSLGVRAHERSVTGEYRNYAEGFAVRIPNGMHGVAADQAGPERGITISLHPGASVTVYGEPNSLEYRTPDEGIRNDLRRCDSGGLAIAATRVGTLRGAKGRLVCGERVTVEMLAFRPGGGPIYCLRLETTRADITTDEHVLETLASTFRVIAWH